MFGYCCSILVHTVQLWQRLDVRQYTWGWPEYYDRFVMRKSWFALVGTLVLTTAACGGEGESARNVDTSPVKTNVTNPTPSPTTAPLSEFLLQTLPIDLASVDWSLVMQHADLYDEGLPISDFGNIDGAGTSNERRNPQPTFFVPLGTVVVAPVDGVVWQVKQLYSGDYSIHFAQGPGQPSVAWETEHVENVLVKSGDTVKAGQPVATVSDYMCFYSRKQFGNEEYCGKGVGLVELGYLIGGNPPRHMCPFGELTAPSALSKIEAEMSAARAEIERIAGKTLFDTANWASANCVSTDPVEG